MTLASMQLAFESCFPMATFSLEIKPMIINFGRLDSWFPVGKIGGSWFPDLCVYIYVCFYIQTSIYIEFYNRIVNN